MRTRVALAVATLLASFAGMASMASASRLPTLLTIGGGAFRVRPTTIDYTGDGTGVIGILPRARPRGSAGRGSLAWRYWTQTSAYGVGTIWLDDCTPDCAAGTLYAHPGTVLAYRVRNSRFTRLKLRFRYHGHAVTDIRSISRNHGYWQYGIVSQTGF
jgi:hypothetical protein